MSLHERYAPVLRFNRDERFFPMRVDDYLRHCSLHLPGGESPVVGAGELTPELLLARGNEPSAFLRSVTRGPLVGPEVVAEWSAGALELVYRWAAAGPGSLPERLARKAYSWFSPKTASATQKFWWNDLVRPLLEGEVKAGETDALPRLTLPLETELSAVEAYDRARPPFTYYYRELQDGAFHCLQYWFFYSYNNWGRQFGGMNDHEGDWEGLMLFFRLDAAGRPQEPPAYVTFADHESRQTKPWDHADLTKVGSHVVGFVGAGSHATYPEDRVQPLLALYNLYDYANGDGLAIDHDDWVHRVALDDVPWLGQFPGSWGTRFWLPTRLARDMLRLLGGFGPFAGLWRLQLPAQFELPGVSAPRGPINPGRPQYARPVAWAGLADLEP